MTRPLEKRNEPRIEFIGEQDGPAEQNLKAELRTWFVGEPGVERAYLAIVGFQPSDQRSVAVCLVSTKSEAIVTGIGAIFARLFRSDMQLDILFLSPAQEEDLKRVCRAFYPG